MDTLDRQPVEPPKDLPAGLKVWNCWLKNKHTTRPRWLSVWYQWYDMDTADELNMLLREDDTLAKAWECMIGELVESHKRGENENA